MHSTNKSGKQFYELLQETARAVRSDRDLSLLQERIDNINPQLGASVKTYHRLGFFVAGQHRSNPLRYHWLADRLKLIYCYIPKNACTLFKFFILQQSRHSGLAGKAKRGEVHKYGHLLNIKKLSELERQDRFKFVVLRNPYQRILSAYLDKFAKRVKPEPSAVNVIRTVRKRLGNPGNIEESITFHEFVNYLIDQDDSNLDQHWRPQSSFVGAIKYDQYIQFEDLEDGVSSLERQFGVPIVRNLSPHRTQYMQKKTGTDDYSTTYPGLFRSLGTFPSAVLMYTPDLQRKIRNRYAEDFRLYESKFGKHSAGLQ